MRWLLLTILVLSALEIGVFVWVGGLIGPWWVVFIIIMTGILGFMIAKKQGIETWNRAQHSIHNGQVPTEQITDGICIFIGAVLLFAPGFITDFVGFLLVLPLTRNVCKQVIFKLLKRIMSKGTIIYRKW